MINYSIRKAEMRDLETIQKLIRDLCLLEQEKFDQTTRTDYSLSEKGKEYFISNIESVDSYAIVAEIDGEIIGYFIGSIKEPEDFRIIKSLAEGDNMYIKESSRENGIGTAFINQFESWCRERKIQRIRYTASANNVDAIKFYESNGSKKYNIILEKELDY